MKSIFDLRSSFEPSGDQPRAIADITQRFHQEERDQVLLGVTGSGKTFTMAHIIRNLGRPSLIIAPNKTLAAQLYGEMREFFPHNAVEYFVSYYDYYQPEAYVPRTDTYIEKEASINEHIDRMRHSATRALFERPDVIIVASVSCIYGIGSKESYQEMTLLLHKGQFCDREALQRKLIELHYKRNDMAFARGAFRQKGDCLDIFPSHCEDRAVRILYFDDEIEEVYEFDPLTGEKYEELESIKIYANSHYVTPGPTLQQAIKQIKEDLSIRLQEMEAMGQPLEAERLRQRVTYDIEMLQATGACAGIENYSRYLTGRLPGEPPPTLFEYLPKEALLIVDESHVSVPQIGAMYKGDAARKSTLSLHGFRLPSCADNRPLKFEEWDHIRPQTLFVSATPGPFELSRTQGVITEQIIRPTGLLDPICEVRPTKNQIDDLLHECKKTVEKGYRVLITTLTKKMAEALTEYMNEGGLRVRYLHSDIDTLERIDIIRALRQGECDVLVGINLLREGLDIPECALVAILDADKEGFLRSKTSLIQTIGRSARNAEGRVLLYADLITRSMREALEETVRRRAIQDQYNKIHGITPTTIQKGFAPLMAKALEEVTYVKQATTVLPDRRSIEKRLKELQESMFKAAADLEFEEAARLRDEIKELEKSSLLLM